ncbi:hypothetical protein C5167_042670 [Papaver somniferum]|uniref:Uncharacterized protein n=1 Tax=Papaver somniferum TaxID=3469 RepID=A0A4Y7L3H1_PAPSO|nr:hypothetical protein C5167_042670 [Papaver somniferum]
MERIHLHSSPIKDRMLLFLSSGSAAGGRNETVFSTARSSIQCNRLITFSLGSLTKLCTSTLPVPGGFGAPDSSGSYPPR